MYSKCQCVGTRCTGVVFSGDVAPPEGCKPRNRWQTKGMYLQVPQMQLKQVQQFNTEVCTVEPPNKGHVGDSITSLVLSFAERLSSSRRLSLY